MPRIRPEPTPGEVVTVYEGDGSAIVLGAVAGSYRTISGGGMDNVHPLGNPFLYDPAGLVTMATTAGKVQLTHTAPPASPQHSFLSNALWFLESGALMLPGLVGPGSFLEVEAPECLTASANPFARLGMGLYAPYGALVALPTYGRMSGLELQPFNIVGADEDYFQAGTRHAGGSVLHTAATALSIGLHTFRVELDWLAGAPNEMAMTYKIDGVQIGAPQACGPMDGGHWCAAGLAGRAETWQIGKITAGTRIY